MMSIEIEKNNNHAFEEIDDEVYELDEDEFKKIMHRDNKSKEILNKLKETISA